MKKLIILAIALVATIGLFAAESGTINLPSGEDAISEVELGTLTKTAGWDFISDAGNYKGYWKATYTQDISYATTDDSKKIRVKKNIKDYVKAEFKGMNFGDLAQDLDYFTGSAIGATPASIGTNATGGSLFLNDGDLTTTDVVIITDITNSTVNDLTVTFDVGLRYNQDLKLTYTISD
jgi:hypothetical protein